MREQLERDDDLTNTVADVEPDEGPAWMPEDLDDVSLARGRRPTLRQMVTGSWVLFIVIFTVVRVVVVKETLQRYGLNIWMFGFIDLITAVPYAIGVARVITSLIDRNRSAAARWLVVAAASFIAPYAYVAWAGKDAEFPRSVWIVLAILVAAFGTNALVSGWRKVRRVRRLRQEADALGSGAD